MTCVLAKNLYSHLESKNLLPEEEKGCGKQSKASKDQLVDKMIIRNRTLRLTGLNVV